MREENDKKKPKLDPRLKLKIATPICNFLADIQYEKIEERKSKKKKRGGEEKNML